MKSTLSLLLVAFGAGCLSPVNGSSLPPECHVDADCPVYGQVCDESLCWGAPPPGTYAALIGPPATNRHDVVVTEVPELAIPFDGNFGDLIIQSPVHIGGRVHLICQAPAFINCDASAAIAANVTVLRPSRIPGGERFVDSASSDESVRDGDSFTLDVPRLSLDDAPYKVIITPSDTVPITAGGPTPAELAPPLTMQVDATDDKVGLDFALGQGALRTVSGRIADATGYGVAGVRVSAMGRFDPLDPNRPLERISTVAVTDASGYYTIYINGAASTIADIVAHPADKVGVTLRLRDVQVGNPTQTIGDLRFPAAGKPIAVTLPVFGHNGAGQATPVAGATVDVTSTLIDKQQVTTFEVTASTDGKGNAALQLIPGTATNLRQYVVRINPAPSSEFASLYGAIIEVGTGGGVLAQIDLPHRVAVTGSLVDADGLAAPGVTVTAQPALRLSLKLDNATQSILSGLQPPSTTTESDGRFFVWVDPDLAGTAASYDLDCVPPDGARTPRWTFHDVTLHGANVNIEMGAIALPRGRHVRGRVVDETSTQVAGSEVRLYQIISDPGLCLVANMSPDCVLPAQLRALDRSDDHGLVRLVLPDPTP